MSALSTQALNGLQAIRTQFGDAAFTDFKTCIESSSQFAQQVEAYFSTNRSGIVSVGLTSGGAAQYQRYEFDLQNGGLNSIRGNITFAPDAALFQRSSGWSVGYGLAESFAHELGHAFDSNLGTTAQAAAFNQGGLQAMTLLSTQSEAKGQINAYVLMSEARVNLLADAGSSYVNIPFVTTSQVTGFPRAEAVIRSLLESSAGSDFAATCTDNAACLAAITKIMGDGGAGGYGYFNSIYRSLTNNPNAQYPSQSALLGEEGNYALVANSSISGQIDVIDKTTNLVVQSINAQLYDDGSALVTVRNRDGTLDIVSINATDTMVHISTSTNLQGQAQQTIETYERDEIAPSQTTTYTDTSADGQWDRQSNAYDADSNGKAELIVNSIYGGAATYSYDANQNGQFENITVAQANGRFDITQTDESGAAAPWKTIETHYASAGVLDDQRIVWDNNSTWLNDWDQAASQSWSYQSTQYTASGQADLQTIDWDGGARWINDWDAASSQIWSYQSTQYTAAGQADLQNITWDNGSKWINDWDAASNQIWSYQSTQYTASGQTDQQTIDWDDASRWVNDWDQGNSNITKLSTTVYTAAGALDRQTVIMDDNSTWANDWDQANTNSWQTMSSLYNSSGAADWQRVGYDNGSYFTNDWDATNLANWSLTTTFYDAQGRADTATTGMDDGRSYVTDYDQQNGIIWTSKTDYLDAQGRVDERTFTYDNNTRIVFDFDETNTKTFNYTELKFNAANVQDFQWIYNDNGSKLLTDWDDTGSQPYKYFTDYFTTSGLRDYQEAFLDGGNRMVFDFDQLGTHNWGTVIYQYNSSNQMISEQIILDTGYSLNVNPYTNPNGGSGTYSPTFLDSSVYDPNNNWNYYYYEDYDWEYYYFA